MEIRDLTADLLEETIKLADEIFPPEYEEEPAKDEIPASLFPDRYREYFAKTGIKPGLKYWVAVESGKVIGLIGLYEHESDLDDLIWLGWFLTDPVSRKKNVGTKLLRFAIQQSWNASKKRLRVYTTDDPDELYSHHFYKKHGFRLVAQKPWKHNPELNLTEFHFELDLTTAQVE